MVDRFEQEERYGPDSNFVKRTRFSQTIEPYQSTEVPAKPGVKPHSRVKELPALPVREHQQDNMLQQQDNMLQDEVVNFGQHVQPHQQQLQLHQQHNIPHNPVYPKQVMSPNRPNVEAPERGGPPGPNALYQQNNLVQQIVHLEWDQELREIVQGNNSSIEQIIAEVQRIKQAMGHITKGLNDAFGQVRMDAQNQHQGMATLHQQMIEVQRRMGILENEAHRLQTAEIGALKERCKKIEEENVTSGRKWPVVHEQLQKFPELEREVRAQKERTDGLERKLQEGNVPAQIDSQKLMEKVVIMERRLQEAGLSTEQLGQHALIREIHRLQLWVQSMNGGYSSNIHPQDWTNPVTVLENRCTQLQTQYESLRGDLNRALNRAQNTSGQNTDPDFGLFDQSNRTQFDQVQSNRTQFDQVQSNRTQSDQVQPSRTQFDPISSNRTQLQSQSMDSNPFGSNPIDANPMGSDQISFNRDGPNTMPSNPIQSNAMDSNQMPSGGLSAGRLNPNPASTSPFDQLNPLRTQSNLGADPRDPGLKSERVDDLSSAMKQIVNLNKYLTTLEGKSPMFGHGSSI